ncbi:MAG: hypothetical protein ABL958_13640, partial [Bdellovibrionia bacterium]
FSGCAPYCDPQPGWSPGNVWDLWVSVFNDTLNQAHSALLHDACEIFLSGNYRARETLDRIINRQSLNLPLVRIEQMDRDRLYAQANSNGTLTIYPLFFRLSPNEQVIVVLHEIGHLTHIISYQVYISHSTGLPIFNPADVRPADQIAYNTHQNMHISTTDPAMFSHRDRTSKAYDEEIARACQVPLHKEVSK